MSITTSRRYTNITLVPVRFTVHSTQQSLFRDTTHQLHRLRHHYPHPYFIRCPPSTTLAQLRLASHPSPSLTSTPPSGSCAAVHFDTYFRISQRLWRPNQSSFLTHNICINYSLARLHFFFAHGALCSSASLHNIIYLPCCCRPHPSTHHHPAPLLHVRCFLHTHTTLSPPFPAESAITGTSIHPPRGTLTPTTLPPTSIGLL